MLNEDYEDLVTGKSVALVGGGPIESWSRVNSCDLVVRVNHHFLHQGGRIDVLYSSCADDLEYSFLNSYLPIKFAWLNKIHMLFGPKNYLLMAEYCQLEQIPFDVYFHGPEHLYNLVPELRKLDQEYKWPYEFAKDYKIFAFSGVLAIHHLTLYPIKSLYVDGTTLFTRYRLTPKRQGCHHTMNQIGYLGELLNNDHRVTFSDELYNIITNPIYGYYR